MKNNIGGLPKPVRFVCMKIFIAAGFKGPVDNKRLAQQVFPGNEAPALSEQTKLLPHLTGELEKPIFAFVGTCAFFILEL